MKSGSSHPHAYGKPVHVRQQPSAYHPHGYAPRGASAAHAPPADMFIKDPERQGGAATYDTNRMAHPDGAAPPPGLSAGEQQALDAADKAVRMGFIRKVRVDSLTSLAS